MDTFAVLCITSLPTQDLAPIIEAFALAQDRHPKLELTVTSPDAGAETFQAADLLICLGTDPDAARTIARAQELGLPVLATEGGVAGDLVQSGRSGFIVASATLPLADAISWLALRPPVRDRLRSGGLLAAHARLAQPA